MLYIDFLKNNIYLELKLLEKNNFFTNKPNFNFSVENIPNQIFGEVSSNVAMINAKNINTNLFDLAEKIKKKLLCKNELKKIEIIKLAKFQNCKISKQSTFRIFFFIR